MLGVLVAQTIPELKERIVEVEKEKAEEIVELREKLEVRFRSTTQSALS
jgi:hypothetical protein